MNKADMNLKLRSWIGDIETEFTDIPPARIDVLHRISRFIQSSLNEHGFAELVFICTHNSRRSQFGQVWADTAARYYKIDGIRAHSGGTETTEFHPLAVEAIERAGFSVEKTGENKTNPRYIVDNGIQPEPLYMFSKKYDDPANPASNFLAIMVCSDADEACPNIPGAGSRISLPYEDPKAFDGTLQETIKYDERCREIARDLFYMFGQVIQITFCINPNH
jgi:hypothetical protein